MQSGFFDSLNALVITLERFSYMQQVKLFYSSGMDGYSINTNVSF